MTVIGRSDRTVRVRQLTTEERDFNSDNEFLKMLDEEQGSIKITNSRVPEIKSILINNKQRRGIIGGN